MHDIFVSYAHEDIERVAPLVELFEANGLSVWWDDHIEPGSRFEDVIDAAILQCELVVVVWSEHSIHSEWVLAEAGDALERGALIPVMFDEVRVPIAFRRAQSVKLLGWPRQRDGRELHRLLQSLLQRLDRKSQKPALPKTAPPEYRRNPLALAALSLTILVALAAIYYVLNPDRPVVDAVDEVPVASISVLPFTSTDGVSLPEAWRGMAFEVADLLRRAAELRIASDEQVADTVTDRLQQTRQFDTDYLLYGAFSSESGAPDQLSISLKDADSGEILHSQRYALSEGNIADTVRRVADNVAARFYINLPILKEDISPEAYLIYLKAQAELRKPTSLTMLEKTRGLFAEVTELEPRFASGFAGLCRAELALYQETQDLKNFESAERHCNRANILNSNDSAVYAALGALYRDSGKPMASLDNLNRAIHLSPFSTQVMRELCRTYIALRRFDDAERQILAALEIEPGFWVNYREMGRIQFIKGDYERAAEYYQLESELAPDNSRALNNLGVAYFLAEQFELAIDVLESTPNVEKNDRTLANLGAAYFFRRQYDRAAEMYTKAIAVAPENHEYWGSLAESESFGGKRDFARHYERALELAKQRLAINPSDTMLLSATATYHAALGQQEEADAIISRLLAMDLNDVYTLYDIARAYARLDRKVVAREYMGKLVGLGYSSSLLSLDANFDGIAWQAGEEAMQ